MLLRRRRQHQLLVAVLREIPSGKEKVLSQQVEALPFSIRLLYLTMSVECT
jgi:hypothetical protein